MELKGSVPHNSENVISRLRRNLVNFEEGSYVFNESLKDELRQDEPIFQPSEVVLLENFEKDNTTESKATFSETENQSPQQFVFKVENGSSELPPLSPEVLPSSPEQPSSSSELPITEESLATTNSAASEASSSESLVTFTSSLVNNNIISTTNKPAVVENMTQESSVVVTDQSDDTILESTPSDSYTADKHEYHLKNNFLTINFNRALEPNKKFRLLLKYEGILSDSLIGYYRVPYTKKGSQKTT